MNLKRLTDRRKDRDNRAAALHFMTVAALLMASPLVFGRHARAEEGPPSALLARGLRAAGLDGMPCHDRAWTIAGLAPRLQLGLSVWHGDLWMGQTRRICWPMSN
jgi:hypothetical protein